MVVSLSVSKSISSNKKARFEYHILDTYEAGLSLQGWEIKSIRVHGIILEGSYIRVKDAEVFLLGAHIKPYEFSKDKEVDPVRPKKLLLKKQEISKLKSKSEALGMTIVPLSLYLKEGRAKLEIALAKGKSAPDKRESIKARESKRELSRVLKNNR